MTEPSGIKNDQEKAPMSLLDYYALEQIALVLKFGAQKYAPHNWRNGFQFTRLTDASLRHIGQWLSGEDKDQESGISHIAHAACSMLFLLWMERNKPELDDRWKR